MPANVDALAIPVGIAVLVTGTVAFVTVLTAMARAVDRLIDAAIAVRARSPLRSASRIPVRRRRRMFGAMPRSVLSSVRAGSLLFALAWFAFVLGRVRDLG